MITKPSKEYFLVERDLLDLVSLPKRMPSLSERTFTVQQQPGSSSSLSGAARSNRRIYLAADILKTFAICAGDAVVLKAVLKADDIDRKASLNGVAVDGGKGEAGRTRGMLGNGEVSRTYPEDGNLVLLRRGRYSLS